MAQWLVVGLGNPGPTYAANRHNIGAMVVSRLADRQSSRWKSHRMLKADLADIRVDTHEGSTGVILARSRVYMNQSGIPVRNLLGWAKIRPDHLIVVHDEIDLDLGQLRAKIGGGDNGHKGLKSIRAMIGTGEFFRVRLGVGRSDRIHVDKWVLMNFPKAQMPEVRSMVDLGADAVESIISVGLDQTQQHFNS